MYCLKTSVFDKFNYCNAAQRKCMQHWRELNENKNISHWLHHDKNRFLEFVSCVVHFVIVPSDSGLSTATMKNWMHRFNEYSSWNWLNFVNYIDSNQITTNFSTESFGNWYKINEKTREIKCRPNSGSHFECIDILCVYSFTVVASNELRIKAHLANRIQNAHTVCAVHVSFVLLDPRILIASNMLVDFNSG